MLCRVFEMSYNCLSQTLQMHLELWEFSISYWNLYGYHYERQISYIFHQFYLQPKVQAVPYIFHIVFWTYQLILNVFHSLKMEKNNLSKCLRCPIEFEEFIFPQFYSPAEHWYLPIIYLFYKIGNDKRISF